MGKEMDDAHLRIEEELPYQAFPETATWGLRYHEGEIRPSGKREFDLRRTQKAHTGKKEYQSPHESIYDGKNTGKYNRKKDSCK